MREDCGDHLDANPLYKLHRLFNHGNTLAPIYRVFQAYLPSLVHGENLSWSISSMHLPAIFTSGLQLITETQGWLLCPAAKFLLGDGALKSWKNSRSLQVTDGFHISCPSPLLTSFSTFLGWHFVSRLTSSRFWQIHLSFHFFSPSPCRGPTCVGRFYLASANL